MGSTGTSLRVLFVVHSAKLGGAQQVALGQARSLVREHELTIAIGHGPLRGEFEKLGPIVRAPTRAPIWGASRGRWALDLARALPDAVRLAGIARRRHSDVVVANSTVLVSAVLAGRLARVPVVVHAQEAPKSVAARRLFRFHGALADTVVAISPWIAESFDGARARILDNPVGIALPPRPPCTAPSDRCALRILVVGTIDAHKRQDLAIDALVRLCAQGVRGTLELVGPEVDAAYGAALRDRAVRAGVDDRVTFAGPCSDVAAKMRAADVVLVPAGEVTPLVLMEAMAHGTPVVAARMGSIPSVVVDGDSGLLVPPDDPAAMALAIRRVATEPGLARRLSARARLRVEQCFDEVGSHQRLEAELERLADGGGRLRAPITLVGVR
jgi:glycosyltransferase involved in cell wall biosynthesis